METTAYIAFSRQMALERQMDVIANNIANATTSGFKAEHADVRAGPGDAGEHHGSPSCRTWARPATSAPGRSSRPATRSTWRSTATAISPSRPPAASRYGRTGQLELERDGRAGDARRRSGARRRRQPDRAAARCGSDHDRRRRHGVDARGRPSAGSARGLRRRAGAGAARRRPLSAPMQAPLPATEHAAGPGRARGLQRPADRRDDQHDGDGARVRGRAAAARHRARARAPGDRATSARAPPSLSARAGGRTAPCVR